MYNLIIIDYQIIESLKSISILAKIGPEINAQ